LDLDYENDVPDSPEINSLISSLHNQAIKMTPILQQTELEENLTFEKTGDTVINTFTCSGKNNGRHNNIEIHPGQVSAMHNPLQDIKLGSIVEMQAMDPDISRTIKILQSKHKVPNFLKKYRLRGASLLIKQDKDKQRIVLPEKAIVRIAGELHILCHSSAKKLDKIINRYFCGKNVQKICTKITGACNFCQRRLPNKCYDAYQGIMPIASRPMQIMSMDFIKLSKHLYVGSKKYVSILNIVDYYSDFCIPSCITRRWSSWSASPTGLMVWVWTSTSSNSLSSALVSLASWFWSVTLCGPSVSRAALPCRQPSPWRSMGLSSAASVTQRLWLRRTSRGFFPQTTPLRL
jgi:hypothetical protein